MPCSVHAAVWDRARHIQTLFDVRMRSSGKGGGTILAVFDMAGYGDPGTVKAGFMVSSARQRVSGLPSSGLWSVPSHKQHYCVGLGPPCSAESSIAPGRDGSLPVVWRLLDAAGGPAQHMPCISGAAYHRQASVVPVQAQLEAVRIAQRHYPERLGLAVVTNPPLLFWALWRAAQPFLDAVTRQGPRPGPPSPP